MKLQPLTIALMLIGILLMLTSSGSGPSPFSPNKVTSVTYVHDEKFPIPSGVTAGLSELNMKGILATDYPDDVTDGDDQVPNQYKVTLPAAKAVGIPALIVQAGDKVLRTVKAPTTKEQVLDAAGVPK